MEFLTLDTLLELFTEDVRPKVLQALDNVSGLAVYQNAEQDQVKALALTSDLATTLDGGFTLVGTYEKPADTGSRTQQALVWLKLNDATPYAAAREFGLDPSAVYRALKRADAKRCPCCGQTVKLPR